MARKATLIQRSIRGGLARKKYKVMRRKGGDACTRVQALFRAVRASAHIAPPTGAAVSPMGAGGPPADRVKRLVATLLDGLIFGVTAAMAFGAGFLSGAGFHWGVGLLSGFGLMSIVWLGMLVCQCYLLAVRGQTIGKIVMGLRIVRFEDGGNPGFVKAVLLRTFLWALITAVPVVGTLIGVVGILFIFRDDQRCLHDHLAGTRVVNA
jgi:uncharacterized RDD family membrane protein YckC